MHRSGYAGGRTGDKGRNRAAASFARRRKTAVRLLDVRGCAETERGDSLFESSEVAAHDRAEASIRHGRAGALILAELGKNVMRGADEGTGQGLAQPIDVLLLVCGVLVAVQEINGIRLHACLLEVGYMGF